MTSTDIEKYHIRGIFPEIYGGIAIYYMEDIIDPTEDHEDFTIMDEFEKFFEDKDNPLLIEFEQAKTYYKRLIEITADNKKTSHLFD